MIVSFTGHRPNKLGNDWEYKSELSRKIYNTIVEEMIVLKPELGIVGGALGVDTIAANALINLNIPFTVAVPFKGQERKWVEKAQKLYIKILTKADSVVVVSPGDYDIKKMHIRNKWMVDNSDILYAVWDGSEGGTKNCVMYAKSVKKEIIRINPNDL